MTLTSALPSISKVIWRSTGVFRKGTPSFKAVFEKSGKFYDIIVVIIFIIFYIKLNIWSEKIWNVDLGVSSVTQNVDAKITSYFVSNVLWSFFTKKKMLLNQ